MRPRSGVVELAGLPGSGKSSLALAVHRSLARRGCEAELVDAGIGADTPRTVRVPRRLWLAGIAVARHPVTSLQLVRAARRLEPANPGDAFRGVVQWLATATLAEGSGVRILQEGRVQTAWILALRTHGDLAPLLTSVGDASGHRHLLVVVDAAIDIVSDRLGARSSRHSRTQRLDGSARVAELVTGQALLERIVVAHPGPCLRVTNECPGDVEALGDVVATWVLDHLS